MLLEYVLGVIMESPCGSIMCPIIRGKHMAHAISEHLINVNGNGIFVVIFTDM